MEPGHGEGDGGSHPSGRPSRQGPFGDGFDVADVGNVENVAESKSVEAGARRDVAAGPCRIRQEAEQRRKIAARPSTCCRLSAALRFGEIRDVANVGDVGNVAGRGDPAPPLQGEICALPTGITSASRYDEGLPCGEVEPARAPRSAGEPLPTADGDPRRGAAFALRAESSRDRRRRVIRAERPAADIPNRAAT